MKTLYPEITLYLTFYLETGSHHAVYVEVSGNRDGIPVIFLHGGPCSGTKPDHRRFFDPERYQIILFDQRGCGQCKPFGEINQNTTQDLIADMEHIRQCLGIEKWLLFGGSWGGTLALLYAQQYTERVLGMIIRGVFLARQQDMAWFAGDGVNRIYPEQWQILLGSSPSSNPKTLIEDLWGIMQGDDIARQAKVAKAWQDWNGQVALGKGFQANSEDGEDSGNKIKQVKMELHYALNGYFIKENQILENCCLLADIPSVIIHGRYDLVCPLDSGLALHHALVGSHFIVLPNAGHIAQHEEMIDALVTATDHFAKGNDFVNLMR